MKVQVYSFDKLIGTADLKVGDKYMGVFYGEFTPNHVYYTEVQPNVWDIYNLIDTRYNCWELLQLTAKDSNGVTIDAVGGITIADAEELPNEPKRLDIAGVDLQKWGLV